MNLEFCNSLDMAKREAAAVDNRYLYTYAVCRLPCTIDR